MVRLVRPVTSAKPSRECAARTCVALACGDGGVCLVFATSTTQQGNLGGLDGADATCQGLADAAQLPGVYMAWLSDDSGSPSTAIRPSRPARTDGWIASRSQPTGRKLTSGNLQAPIDKTESGDQVPSDGSRWVWSNTTTSGTLLSDEDNSNCFNWTSNQAGMVGGKEGIATVSTGFWTVASGASCDFSVRLYCFQQS